MTSSILPRGAGWGHDSKLKLTQQLPPSPIASDNQFTSLQTVGELVEEGQLMHHCVATRGEDAIAGICAIYRVKVAGQRGTLEVSIGPNGGEPVAIDEFRLACNVEPSSASWSVAQHWLFNAKTKWFGVFHN